MVAYFESRSDAADAVSAIIAAHITPETIEFLDRTTIRCVEEYAHLGLPTSIESLLLIEVDGRPTIVEEEAARIAELCKRGRCIEFKTAQNHADALRLKTARRAAFSALARVKPTTILEDVTVPQSEISRMLKTSIESQSGSMSCLESSDTPATETSIPPASPTKETKTRFRGPNRPSKKYFRSRLRWGELSPASMEPGCPKRSFLPRQPAFLQSK